MKKIALFLFILFAISSFTTAQELEAVESVDLTQYAGKWYEIASFPQPFQKGCFCTTAEYTVTDKGYIVVENTCNKDSVTGKTSYIKGKAFVDDNTTNAKLKVQFFWPFKGKYWIIDLADDYSYAVVSHPNRKYLWILSRTKTIDSVVYDQIIERLKQKGLDVNQLKITVQD